MSENRDSYSIRFDVDKFDGRINFSLWLSTSDILIQSRLHKVLKSSPITENSNSTSVTGEINSRYEMSNKG